MNKREMVARKTQVAREIMNIKRDYSAVDKEDMPEDIVDELETLNGELQILRDRLDALA